MHCVLTPLSAEIPAPSKSLNDTIPSLSGSEDPPESTPSSDVQSAEESTLIVTDAADDTKNTTNGLRNGGTAMALLATVKAGPATIDASYASLEGDSGTNGIKLKKQTLSKAIVSVPAGGVTVVAGMAKGGNDGDLVTFDSDAKVGFEGWNVRAGKAGQDDLSAYTGAVVVPVGSLKVKAQYTSAEYDDKANNKTDLKVDEMMLQADFSLAKNFGGYLRYATVDFNDKAGDGDFNRCRLSLKYTF